MVAALADEELEAVLVHEAEHARRRDPLRRLAGRAAADVLFWLPLVGWWSRRRLEDAELAADRAAIDRVGRRPLARALRATAVVAAPGVGARFDGAGPARSRNSSAISCRAGGHRWRPACCRCWA
jgi:beta-lactamase regulating signal transducer with metallopeptidase domain